MSQRYRNGQAAAGNGRRNRSSSTTMATAVAGANHMERKKPGRSTRAPRLASLDVFHSSRLRLSRGRAPTFRAIASRLTYASYGRKTRVKRNWARCRPSAAPVMRRCDRRVISAGLAASDPPKVTIEPRSDRGQHQGDRGRPQRRGQHPGHEQERQHRGRHEAAAEVVEDFPPREPGDRIGDVPRPQRRTRGSSQPASCQSPRIQRCRRLTLAG